MFNPLTEMRFWCPLSFNFVNGSISSLWTTRISSKGIYFPCVMELKWDEMWKEVQLVNFSNNSSRFVFLVGYNVLTVVITAFSCGWNFDGHHSMVSCWRPIDSISIWTAWCSKSVACWKWGELPKLDLMQIMCYHDHYRHYFLVSTCV